MRDDQPVFQVGHPILGPPRMALGARQFGVEGPPTLETQLAWLEARVTLLETYVAALQAAWALTWWQRRQRGLRRLHDWIRQLARRRDGS